MEVLEPRLVLTQPWVAIGSDFGPGSTPPSPSMNPSPPLSLDIGTMDHFGTADAAGAAAAGTIGSAAPAIEARVSPMRSRRRIRPPYVISGQ